MGGGPGVGEGGREIEGGGTHFMHNRSHRPVDPRIPSISGKSTSVFTDQAARGGAGGVVLRLCMTVVV